eukprot:COSAG01_NODE_7390_length_3227_cov_5.475703_2_plen_108_part_00
MVADLDDMQGATQIWMTCRVIFVVQIRLKFVGVSWSLIYKFFTIVGGAGSVIDAMSEAVEGAEVMLYGVCAQYKESANCRLELSCKECENHCFWLSIYLTNNEVRHA